MARESKFTAQVVESLLSEVAAGTPTEEACEKAGVHHTQFYRWQRLGRKGHAAFTPFVTALDAARKRNQDAKDEAIRRALRSVAMPLAATG